MTMLDSVDKKTEVDRRGVVVGLRFTLNLITSSACGKGRRFCRWGHICVTRLHSG